jgi:hypothetical protein
MFEMTPLIRCKGLPAAAILTVMLAAGAISCASATKVADFQLVSVSVVDYHDQVELPSHRSAALEPLLGRDAAAGVADSVMARASKERPHRSLLRVEFRSAKNLWKIAQTDGGATISVHSYFCAREKDWTILGVPVLFSQGQEVRKSAAQMDSSNANPGERADVYYVYLNVSRRESLSAIPPEHGFDLREKPEDVCFYITGWLVFPGTFYKSQVIRVSEEVIAAAFQNTGDPHVAR